MYCLTFCSIEMAVKSADKQYHPNIISSYIIMGLDRAKEMDTITDTKSIHLRIYHTLLNTMCDTCIPMEWREVCYKYLNKMMPLLSAIFNAKDLEKYKSELMVLGQYFCNKEYKPEESRFCYSFETKNN